MGAQKVEYRGLNTDDRGLNTEERGLDTKTSASEESSVAEYITSAHSGDITFSLKCFTLWRSCRPWTLPISVVPVVLTAVVLSVKLGVEIEPTRFIVTTVAFMSLQVSCNIHNAYADFFRGLDTKENAKDRVLVDAILSPRTVVIAIAVFAMVFFVYLGHALLEDRPDEERLHLLVIGAIGLFAAYSYSGSPLSLKVYGVGELDLFLCMGILAPLFQCVYLSGNLHYYVMLMLLPLSFSQTGINHANNYRDMKIDKEFGAITSANVLGRYWARIYYNALVFFLPYATIFVLSWYFECFGVLCGLFAIPLSITLMQMANGSQEEIFVLVKRTAKVHFVLGSCMIIGVYTMPSTTLNPVGLGVSAAVGLIPSFLGLRGELQHMKYW